MCIIEKVFYIIMNNVKDNIHRHAIGKILSFLNKLLYENFGPTPDITLTTLFCGLNVLNFPQKIIP